MNNSKSNNLISYLKILVYGIITPSIISFGIYYTFSSAIKIALKEALTETFDKSLGKKIKEVVEKSFINNFKKNN